MNSKRKTRVGGWIKLMGLTLFFLWFLVQLALVPSPGQRHPLRTNTGISPRRIVYVHIGKTGGEWIKSQLAVICKTRKNPKLKQSCLDSFQTLPSTQLSQQTVGYFHVHNLYPRNAHALASHYLFSIRHPLKRLISWYIYNHPQSCDPREPNSPSCKSNEWKTQFFDCFPTLEALGMMVEGDTCAQVLWNGWNGQVSDVKQPNHLYWNYKFYWNQTFAHSSKPILVVRQERLTLDMNELESYLQTGSITTPIPWRPSESEHVVTGRVSSALTPLATRNLCCLLRNEMEIYQAIVEQAENLALPVKKQTIEDAYQVCGTDLLSCDARQKIS